MDWLALHFLLLVGLLSLYNGCAGPSVLCCSGQNNNCYRGCFCDEACVVFRDCCPDYNSTCAQSLTTALPNGLSTTNSSTTSTPVDGSTATAPTASDTTAISTRETPRDDGMTSAFTVPTATGTTLREARTSLDTTSVTYLPTDGSTSTVSEQKPDPRSTISTDEDVLTAIVHLKVSVLICEEKNEDVIVEALSSFVSQAQALFLQSCEGCTLKIRHIKPT
ncbi:mucin-5AC isoform X2 [Seriola aureovittata]|uniref:mucin-5AC isoform X2 n=1 Tax=Seriola aureovittata TaxID=2871759 RepID=UPI0024BE3480|nr:mucin-5AC isoform X2 [Seriola aureovittata]